MGFRTAAAGLDLNRDHLKLDSAEARALMALVNAWRPHLHIDNHVTDGSVHPVFRVLHPPQLTTRAWE